jgi:hypothetical protein
MALMDMSIEQGIHGIQHFMDHIFLTSWLPFDPYKWNQDVVFIAS